MISDSKKYYLLPGGWHMVIGVKVYEDTKKPIPA